MHLDELGTADELQNLSKAFTFLDPLLGEKEAVALAGEGVHHVLLAGAEQLELFETERVHDVEQLVREQAAL